MLQRSVVCRNLLEKIFIYEDFFEEEIVTNVCIFYLLHMVRNTYLYFLDRMTFLNAQRKMI